MSFITARDHLISRLSRLPISSLISSLDFLLKVFKSLLYESIKNLPFQLRNPC